MVRPNQITFIFLVISTYCSHYVINSFTISPNNIEPRGRVAVLTHKTDETPPVFGVFGASLPKRTVARKSCLLSFRDDNIVTSKIIDNDVEIIPPFSPRFATHGPIGLGNFTISRLGGPTLEELSNENMLQIVREQCTDLEVNTLVWKCLGYRFDTTKECWTDDECFPKWRDKHPVSDKGGYYDNPPDLLGMQRVYSKEVDQPCLKSNQDLVRTIPAETKKWVIPTLKPFGWKGYQMKDLTPNKTRRAQCANWLIYYREELFGYTIDELRERREKRQRQKQQQAKETEQSKIIDEMNDRGEKDEWKPPVKEVF